jgi:DNA polymerase-3 subunit gamma/tau
MPSLISQRPKDWNQIVGQDRVVRILQAALRNPKFMVRGFIFRGPYGVGKTTVAYILARALLCKGADPLGCGKCQSCRIIDSGGIDQHADFYEVDAASTTTDPKFKSGVEAAHEILDRTEAVPSYGRRRVTIIDEAQRLSPEAWDVFLKPLEQGTTNAIFIFVSNEADKIKAAMRSRCHQLAFDRVSNTQTMIGFLARVAAENQINYELDGLKLIARYAKGIVRDAVQWLNSAAQLGGVTVQNVQDVIDTSLEDAVVALLKVIASRDKTAAIKLADEVALKAPPSEIIKTMASVYGRAVFSAADNELHGIYTGLPTIGEVSGILIKWSTAQNMPADVLPLIAYQLLGTKGGDTRIKLTPPVLEEIPTAIDEYRAPSPPPRPLAVMTADFLNEDEVL